MGSRPTAAGASWRCSARASLSGIYIEKWLLEIVLLLDRTRSPRLGELWKSRGGGRRAGFPTVVGRSGGEWPVARSFPHPVSFHSLGWGLRFACPGGPGGVAMAAAKSACGPA